jgi:predicted porin
MPALQPDSHRRAGAVLSASAPRRRRTRRAVRGLAALVVGAGLCGAAQAQMLQAGPFSLTGFLKGEVGLTSNVCDECQLRKGEDRHRIWADDIALGKDYDTDFVHNWQFQPVLNANFNLGGGFKLAFTLSQRFIDGDVDFPGYWYDRSVTVKHEDYGALQVGAFVLRTWGFADFPYATDIGMSPMFSDSGAGYGLATNAIRYTTRVLDVAEGDLVLELTYDRGDTDFEINEPWLLEFWAHYGRGNLRLDLMIQDTRNGRPTSFTKGPFTSLTPFPADDPKLGESSQSVILLMGKYRVNPQYEVSGGIRFNRWSGAYAVNTGGDQWNAMWNVDWGGFDANGVPNPGYSARTTDVMLGVRRFDGPWASHIGVSHLGKASTDNPSERGQSNSAWFGSIGTRYFFRNGLELYGSLNAVYYDRKGLAPLSMPAHDAFSRIDSRVTDQGNWITLGAVYNF